MATNLRGTRLIDLCTPSISYDRQVQAASGAFDNQMWEIIDDTGQVIMIPNIMDLTDSTLVDILAWQFHVDFYDPTRDLEFRKRLVQMSIIWHKTKGTYALVQEVLDTYWPGGAIIEEWFQYRDPFPPNYPTEDPDVVVLAFNDTMVNVALNRFDFINHGLSNNTAITFVLLSPYSRLPTPVSPGIVYYTANVATDHFQIAERTNGPLIVLRDTGLGISQLWRKGSGSWHDRYRFRILIDEDVISPEDEAAVLRLIDRYKPVSRWCEGLFRATIAQCDIGVTGMLLRFIYHESDAPDYDFDQPIEPPPPWVDMDGAIQPTAIPTAIWCLRADSLALANNAPVPTWTGEVGGVNALATNGYFNGNPPIFKTNVRNGKPALRFNGVDQWLGMDYLTPHHDPPYGVFVIGKQTSKSNNALFLVGHGDDHLLFGLDAATGHFHAGKVDGANLSDAADHSGQFHLLCLSVLTFDGVSSCYAHLYVDGQKVASGTIDYNQISLMLIGATYGEAMIGDIFETFAVRRRLSEYHRQGVEIYARNKYHLADPPQRERLSAEAESVAVLWMKANSLDLLDGTQPKMWQSSCSDHMFGSQYGPTFETDIVNGLPALRFNNNYWDGLQLRDIVSDNSATLGLSQPNTIIVVTKGNAPTGFAFMLDCDVAPRQLVHVSDQYFHMYAGTSLVDNTDYTGQAHVFSCAFDGANSKGWVDGVLKLSGNAGTAGIGTPCIGRNDSSNVYANGDTLEIVILNGVSDAARQAEELRLKAKYNTP